MPDNCRCDVLRHTFPSKVGKPVTHSSSLNFKFISFLRKWQNGRSTYGPRLTDMPNRFTQPTHFARVFCSNLSMCFWAVLPRWMRFSLTVDGRNPAPVCNVPFAPARPPPGPPNLILARHSCETGFGPMTEILHQASCDGLHPQHPILKWGRGGGAAGRAANWCRISSINLLAFCGSSVYRRSSA